VHTVTLMAEIQMKFTRTCVVLVAIIITPTNFAEDATPQPKQSEIDSADRLY